MSVAEMTGPAKKTVTGKSEDPWRAYRALLAAGALAEDAAQEAAATRLQDLHERLLAWEKEKRAGWLRRSPPPAPRGLYLHGAVGSGKSMLMDLFFATAPVARKRRVHFHAFMQEVHARLHRGRESRPDADPIPLLAERLATETRLLCFDEFHVANIADAMILARLFAALFARGLVMVATSNQAPGELYRGGLQRERFLPFIPLLERHVEVFSLAGLRDYRRDRLRDLTRYHLAPEAGGGRHLAAAFARLTDGADPTPAMIEVLGRSLEIERQSGRVAWFEFADLCGRSLGAADYLAIAARYEVLLLEGVPPLSAERREEAHRFATLIDVLYEHRVVLIVAARAALDALFQDADLAAMFARSISRLHEMQSRDYPSLPHSPSA